MAAKKPNPFSKGFEAKESMKMEKKEPLRMQKREAKMGVEQKPKFKCGGKVKGK